MATTSTIRPFDLIQVFLTPFRALGFVLIRMAKTSARGQALDRLNRTSDDELAACSTTRVAEARRLLGSRGYF